jgi:2-oxo-hept-3-ene-1,7-dioate hydratase
MLDQPLIAQLAARLAEAEKTRCAIRHFSLEYPGLTIDDAYAIQRAWVDMKIKAGRTTKGRKIGLTSRAMQLVSGMSEPDYGVLFDDMFWDDAAEVPVERFIAPRVEAELAFHLKKNLSGDCTIFDVLNATDFVVPAIEILDARMHTIDPSTKTGRKITDTISDNASNAALVLGGRPFRPDKVDLRWISVLCHCNGKIEETGVAAGVLGHPANGIVWLARKLAPHGELLEAGQTILSGSFIRPISVSKGATIQCDFGSFGSVSCFFN